jgi:hypothetical protein
MTRTPLPARRHHETFTFEHWGQDYAVGIGSIDGYTPQEIFLNCSKSGWAAETLARDSAVLMSIALQHGVTLEEMRRAITRNLDGTASGPIGLLLDLLMARPGAPPAEPEGAPVEPTPPDDLGGGHGGFDSREAYEAHYSDPKNYADEIPAMEAYTRESALEGAADGEKAPE